MTRAALARAAGVLVACGLAGCGSKHTTGPGAGATGPPIVIAFASNRPPAINGGWDQYFYDAASGKPSYMPPNVNSTYDELDGGLSADGHWFAFKSTRTLVGTLTTVFRYDVRSAEVHPVDITANYPGAQNVALSGDGRYLAFHYQCGCGNGGFSDFSIGMVDAVAETAVVLPTLHMGGVGEFDPELSADGKLIAFTSNRDFTDNVPSLGVYLYSVAGDSIVPLPGLNTAYSETGVSLSADGRYVAFHSNRPGGTGNFDVYVYDRRTGTLLPMPGANTGAAELNTALSPDGRYVAYESQNDGGGGDIRLYDLQQQKRVMVPGLNDPYFIERYPTVSNRP